MSVQMDENLGARRGDDLLDALARQLGGRFTARTVFGEPIERGAVTVIPVAALRFGFGGGSGSDPEKRQQGEGGGAGGISRPVGHIEIRGDGSRFVPVVDPVRVVAVVAAATCAALLITRRR